VRLPGISVSRERLPTGDVIFVDGLLVTTRERAVLDCLRRLPPRAAAELLDRALQQRWITQDWLVGRVHDFAGRPGVGRLVRLVRDCGDGARSAAERLLVRELRAAGIGGWVANHPVYDARGALVGVVDLAFVARRLAVEVDGRAWHSAGDRFQRDRERQNRLVAAGWTVLRFTWHDLTARPDRVVATIAGLLARSGEEPTGRAATEVPVGAGAPVGSRA
jgi:very-short-patch-repair endonuclease